MKSSSTYKKAIIITLEINRYISLAKEYGIDVNKYNSYYDTNPIVDLINSAVEEFLILYPDCNYPEDWTQGNIVIDYVSQYLFDKAPELRKAILGHTNTCHYCNIHNSVGSDLYCKLSNITLDDIGNIPPIECIYNTTTEHKMISQMLRNKDIRSNLESGLDYILHDKNKLEEYIIGLFADSYGYGCDALGEYLDELNEFQKSLNPLFENMHVLLLAFYMYITEEYTWDFEHENWIKENLF